VRKLRTLIRNSKKQLDKELCGCLLIVRRFWSRRRGLLSRQTSVLCFSKSFSETHPSSATCALGHWRWWSRWPTYSYKSKGSASSLNCHFFVDSIFFCRKFFLSLNIPFFSLFDTTHQIWTLRSGADLSRPTSSRLTSPVSKPNTT
jgi:hypothetical protein